MADDNRKTIPQLPAGGVVTGSLFESSQPASTASGYASVKVTSDDIASYVGTTRTYAGLKTNTKYLVGAINEAAESGGGASVVQLTAAQYEALSMTEKMNGSIYKLTDKAVMYCLDEEYHALKELTSAQYDALSVAEQNNGTLYIQTDAETTGSDIKVSSSSSETIAEAIGDIQTDIDSIPTFDTEFLTATTGTTTPYTGYYYADIQKTKSGTIVSALVYDTTSNRLAFCQALDSTTIRVWSLVSSTTIKVRVLLMN